MFGDQVLTFKLCCCHGQLTLFPSVPSLRMENRAGNHASPRYPVCCRQSCLNPRVKTHCHSLFLHSPSPRFFPVATYWPLTLLAAKRVKLQAMILLPLETRKGARGNTISLKLSLQSLFVHYPTNNHDMS